MVTLHVPLFSLSLHLITLVYVRMEDVNVSVCTKGIMHASILRVTIFFAIVHPRTKSWSMQLLNYQLPRKTHAPKHTNFLMWDHYIPSMKLSAAIYGLLTKINVPNLPPSFSFLTACNQNLHDGVYK